MTNIDGSLTGAWPAQPPTGPPTAGYPGGPPPVAAAPWSANDWDGHGVPPLSPTPPGSGSGPGSGAPGGRRPSRLPIAAIAVVVALVLLAGAFAAGTKISSSSDRASGPSSSSSTSPSSTAPKSSTTTPSQSGGPSTTTPGSGGGGAVDPQAVKAEVAKLQAYVEQDRGLKFKNDVDVTVLNPADFKARALSEFDKGSDKLKSQGELLQALGLVPADADPVEVQRQALGDGVLGFYDPKTKVLVVKGTAITPFWREIVTHELTHALDDQNFGLDRPDIDNSTDGRSDAWTALVEGSARRVEFDYVRSLSSADKQAIVTEELGDSFGQAGSLTDTPLALAAIIQSPYDYGEPFVRSVLKDHQQAGLDSAFANPPTSTEQILQPDKFDTKDAPKPVAKPPADGDVVSDGTLGELMTGFTLNGPLSLDDLLGNMLGGGAGNGNIDPNQILNGLLGGLGGDPGSGGSSTDPGSGGLGDLGGLSGMFDDPTQLATLDGLLPKADQVKNWGGDHFVVYHSSGNLCVRIDWTMDSPKDLTTFSGQLQAWAAKDAAVKVESPTASSIRATRCVPSSGGAATGAPGI